jgi:RNA polymerase sigma-70 factor (ECF subfamily)
MLRPPLLRLVHDARLSQAAEAGELQALEDPELIGLVLAGDGRAFEALYRRHAPFAINLAVRLQGAAQDAEDLVHDAFLKVHERLHELRERAAFRSWLGSIVVRLVRSRLRRERLARFLGLSPARDSGVELESLAAHDASPEVRAQLAQVYALLGTMPADLRITWVLRFIENHRLEAVAELCGCSLATAKRRLSKAQQLLELHFVDPGLADVAADGGSHRATAGKAGER